VTLTAQQPENNVVRVTVQALAAVLGGCQSLHTNSMDEALALPTQAAATLALRTQQVIAHETGVADMVDPLGGSFAVEAATDAIEKTALQLLDGIEARGGALRGIERGEIQREIEESAYRFQRSLEVQESVVVGVNQFIESDEAPRTDLLRVDPVLERHQVERLRALRARRDSTAWAAAMKTLESTARGQGNLMPAMIDAVLAWATVGEIATCLRGVFGEHRDSKA
jgi:methylmalonyl-CoA mutase N-terminal domain/subunit